MERSKRLGEFRFTTIVPRRGSDDGVWATNRYEGQSASNAGNPWRSGRTASGRAARRRLCEA